MRVRAHHVAASLFAGAIFLASAAYFGLQAPSASATCSVGANIAIHDPLANSTVSGLHPLHAGSTSTAQPSGVTFILSAPTSVVLGNAAPQASGSVPDWVLNWNSTTIPDGNYQMTAIAHYNGGSAYDCNSSPVPVIIHNAAATGSQNPTLVASITPNTWQGVPGQQGSFTVRGVYTNQFGTQYPVASGSSTIAWDTNAGNLGSNGQISTTLISGATVGGFFLGATVSMNGLTTHPTAAIKVVSSTSGGAPSPTPLPPPPTTQTAGNQPPPTASSSSQAAPASVATAAVSQQDAQRLSETPTVFRPTAPTNSNPIVPIQTLSCLERTIGADFDQIASGQSKPSALEKRKAANCFTGSDRIPATLAPVDPSRITELDSETSYLKLGSAKNETIANKRGDKVAAILINGSGAPNTSVFIYIFSDPMVLRAETDKQGNWTYVLQNPLKPGKHEIYAVAAKDSSSFVRTSAIPITIAAASPGSQDGSLVIEHGWQPAQVTYVAIAALMIVIAIFLTFKILERSHPLVVTPVVSFQPQAPHPASTLAIPNVQAPIKKLTPAETQIIPDGAKHEGTKA